MSSCHHKKHYTTKVPLVSTFFYTLTNVRKIPTSCIIGNMIPTRKCAQAYIYFLCHVQLHRLVMTINIVIKRCIICTHYFIIAHLSTCLYKLASSLSPEIDLQFFPGKYHRTHCVNFGRTLLVHTISISVDIGVNKSNVESTLYNAVYYTGW